MLSTAIFFLLRQTGMLFFLLIDLWNILIVYFISGYHWDCSDWAHQNTNPPLPNITEVPGSEIQDTSSFHSNESNESNGSNSNHRPLNGNLVTWKLWKFGFNWFAFFLIRRDNGESWARFRHFGRRSSTSSPTGIGRHDDEQRPHGARFRLRRYLRRGDEQLKSVSQRRTAPESPTAAQFRTDSRSERTALVGFGHRFTTSKVNLFSKLLN